jgi:uncharacterized Zn-binding protein involved in type VI secretion
MPGMPAARMGDNVLQSGPHCHAPIHPPAPTPTPLPHPPMPLTIVKGEPTVLIGKKPAARVTDMTAPCSIIPCIPAGPGMIMQGSATVMIGKMPAARVTDSTLHASCVAPIPGPKGMIIPAGEPTVLIGGPTFSMSLLDAIVAWVKAEFKFTDLALASADANEVNGEGPGAGATAWGSAFGSPPGGTFERMVMDAKRATGQPLTDREKFLAATSNMRISSSYSSDDRAKVEADLQKNYNTPSGKETIDSINKSGKPVLIAPPDPDGSGNSCGAGYNGLYRSKTNTDAYPPPKGTGQGTGSVIAYDPNHDDIANGKTNADDDTDGWRKRPPGVGLGHELMHADHNANGTNATPPGNKESDHETEQDDSLVDPATGKPQKENPEELKTGGIPPHQNDPGPNENKLRQEWCSFNPDDCKGYPHDGDGLKQRNSYNGTGKDFKKDPNAPKNQPPTPTPLPGNAGQSDLGGGGTGIG